MSIVVSGLGVISAIGQGKQAFTQNLLAGKQVFSNLLLPGRQFQGGSFIGAEIKDIDYPSHLPDADQLQLGRSAKIALATLDEAWSDSQLDNEDPARIGLFVAGSNFQQRDLHLLLDKHRDRPFFLNPSYAMQFMDTDLVGLCTEAFDIQGMACTIGGASCSGQMGIIQAMQSLLSEALDFAIVLAPVMDLSYWECQAFRSIGAMGSERYKDDPTLAMRPFDQNRDGFIFGESCGALVLKRQTAQSPLFKSYAEIKGWGSALDRNRKPNSSMKGQVAAIQKAFASAGLSATNIDYINPHGTGSKSGDVVELETLEVLKLQHASINTSKSILGHGLSSAGLVEVIASIVQMQSGYVHPSLNLANPIQEQFSWVRGECEQKTIENALTLSYGFGGINTALCLGKI